MTKGKTLSDRAQSRKPTRARGAEARVAAVQARTVKAQTRFLRHYAVSGNVFKSCKASKVGRRTVYEWLKDDAAFKQLYLDAVDDAVDGLEEEARRRAVDGVLKPVYQGGDKVGEIREYSDALLITLLKGKRPEIYRERLEHTGKNGQPIRTETKVTFGGRYRPGAETP